VPAYDLLRSGTLPGWEYARLDDIISWFERHLPLPDRSKLKPRTIFWFKPNGHRFIRKIWDVVAVLKENGLHVEMLKTARPGRVCYEDDYQVAAVPFRDRDFD
jgi:hypothetical protein